MELRRYRLIKAVNDYKQKELDQSYTDDFMQMAQVMGESQDTRSLDEDEYDVDEDDVDDDHH
ncbi:hypothetical protein IW139_002381 [Coemansia sp. RSA 353]|nr:hypothetical protein IW139_002381 [Coemansia sp. RSA 353]KAJ2552905.1 hypothetical protein IWW35_002102 [Coemansia sp. RSA 1878]